MRKISLNSESSAEASSKAARKAAELAAKRAEAAESRARAQAARGHKKVSEFSTGQGRALRELPLKGLPAQVPTAKTDDSILYRQPDGYTCGPSSLTMALAAWGVAKPNEATMRRLEHEMGVTPATGVPGNASVIARQAEKEGLNARYDSSNEASAVRAALEKGHTCVVNGSLSSGGHFIYVAGINKDGTFNVKDPAGQLPSKMTSAQLTDFMQKNAGAHPPGFAEIWKDGAAAPSKPETEKPDKPGKPSEPRADGGTYSVVHGDTLWAIAKQHGVSLQQLIAANPQIANPDLIYPGDKVHIPGGGVSPSHATPSHSGPSPTHPSAPDAPSAPSAPGGPDGPSAGSDPGSRQGRIDSAMKYFESQGWTRAQAAGIVSNLVYESGGQLNPHQQQFGGGPGYGIAQWEGPRQADFRRVMGVDVHNATYAQELQFVQWELTHTESAAGNALKQAHSPNEAAYAVLTKFERPADPSASAGEREALARQING